MIFGVPVSGGEVSLMPMTVAAAYLVMGLVWAGWITYFSAIIHGWVRYHWAESLTGQPEQGGIRLLFRTTTNATMHSASILTGGAIFQVSGGSTPLTGVDASNIPQLLLLGVTTLSVNYVFAGAYLATLGQPQFRSYLGSLHKVALYEGIPLVFAVLMALTYTQLGLGYFVLLSLNLVIGSLIARNLDLANRRLGRRVRELNSLQAVGQALSASLDIEDVVTAIYSQVADLMPAREFYIALYNPQLDEVEFPLAIEEGERSRWRSRRAGNGLTEYVLRTREPLLISHNVRQKTTDLGLDHIGHEAACWLGVPILSGGEPLGVLAVQSYATPRAYDASHKNILLTIAAQAAVAIQNARLYARTDESLARRVQELDSILRTARDGIMLLDLDWQILTANRMLASWINVPESEIVGQSLKRPHSHGEPLLRLIGYTLQALEADCEALAEEELGQKEAIILLGPVMRHVERTLIPVRDRGGAISGWLLVFRDMTEEMEIERLKDDMTEMLVHDLRSPLTAVMGSVALLKRAFDNRNDEQFDRLRLMAQNNSERILRIVNQLLDISRLESGELPLDRDYVDINALFHDAQSRYTPLLAEAQISFTVEIAPDVPLLYADSTLIGRVLDNLLDNAIKFTPDGGHVRLWAKCDQRQEPTATLIGVSDTGPGISPDAQSRLFSKFQQVASIEGRRGGTGLGLAFCKLAVEAHNGRIWVESEVGRGSTFILALPIEEPQ
jgi:signal transduction histidine kinase